MASDEFLSDVECVFCGRTFTAPLLLRGAVTERREAKQVAEVQIFTNELMRHVMENHDVDVDDFIRNLRLLAFKPAGRPSITNSSFRWSLHTFLEQALSGMQKTLRTHLVK